MSESKKKIITRFPPSPTGHMQMGNVRTAIFNYLYAKKHGGEFILRIEDTDKERSKIEYEEELIDNLKWLGLNWDNKVIIHQSERGKVYSHYIEKLLESGKAYISKEDTQGDPNKRAEVIRFKNPNKEIVFSDIVRGEIKFDTTELGDFVIARSITEPVYHLAVVVDDFESEVTHVIRGEDHISNTPRQILIQEAIGAPRPIYAHLPLILDSDRAKLSKRKLGIKVSLKYFREQGYLPRSIINYMAMLGWNPGTDQEIFTLEELVEVFDIAKVQKAGAIFNEEKLKWVNKEHLKRISFAELAQEIRFYFSNSERLKSKKWRISDELLIKTIPVILDRVNIYAEINEMLNNGELDFIFEAPEYEASDLIWKDEEGTENTAQYITDIINMLESAEDEVFSRPDDIKNIIWGYATEKGRGAVLWPTRFALTGMTKSPDPFTVIHLLGRKESIDRLNKAVKKIKGGN